MNYNKNKGNQNLSRKSNCGSVEFKSKNSNNCSNSNSNNCINNYKMESQFNLNNQSRLSYDKCEINTSENQSEYAGKYMTSNYHSCDCTGPNVSDIAYSQPNINYRDGYGHSSMNGCNIDKDSVMRNGSIITHQGNTPQQLFTRPYLTIPFMGRGVGNSCTESELLTGEQTGSKRQCNTLSEVTINNSFTPLVPCLENNIQNPRNLIPEIAQRGWVRGGVPSRQIIKNIDYAQKCGPNI